MGRVGLPKRPPRQFCLGWAGRVAEVLLSRPPARLVRPHCGVWHILRLIGLDTRGYSVVLWHVGSNVISDKYIRIGPSTIVFGQGIPVAGQVLTMSPMCSFRSTFNPCQNVRRGKNRPWHPPCTELPSQVNLSLWPMSKFWPRLKQTLAQIIGTITSTYAAKWFSLLKILQSASK